MISFNYVWVIRLGITRLGNGVSFNMLPRKQKCCDNSVLHQHHGFFKWDTVKPDDEVKCFAAMETTILESSDLCPYQILVFIG